MNNNNVKAIYNTARVIIAILAVCISIINLTGIFDTKSVYVDDELATIGEESSTMTIGAFVNFFVSILYIAFVAMRYTRIHRYRIMAWALRLFDVAMIISLLAFLWVTVNA